MYSHFGIDELIEIYILEVCDSYMKKQINM
jgi:hypothetical protein